MQQNKFHKCIETPIHSYSCKVFIRFQFILTYFSKNHFFFVSIFLASAMLEMHQKSENVKMNRNEEKNWRVMCEKHYNSLRTLNVKLNSFGHLSV